MTCGDNKVFKIKNPKEKYNTGAEQTRTSTKLELDQVPWRNTQHLLTGPTRRVLFVVIWKTIYQIK